MEPLLISFFLFTAIMLSLPAVKQIRSANSKILEGRISTVAAREVKKRMAGTVNINPRKSWQVLVIWLSGLFIFKRLGKMVDKRLEEADIPLSGAEFIIITVMASTGTAAIIASLSLSLQAGLISWVLAWAVSFLLVGRTRSKLLSGFNAQIGDALALMAGSLRSGFSFLQSIDMVRRELPDPISREFSRTFREINLGVTTEEALLNMAKRVSSEDLDLVITAVLIQRQVGGNLAEVLDNIAETIRERIRIQREIKALTAQGRISGLVIGLLPVLLGVLMYLVNPPYMMALFTNKIGLMLLAAAAVGEAVGMLFIKRIINIRV